MGTKLHYTIRDNETGNFLVIDSAFPFKVFNDSGEMLYQSGFVAGFKTKKEAEEWAERLNLRRVWGK